MPRPSSAANAQARLAQNTRHAIGKRIAHQRAVLGMSQAALADKFGVSKSAIAQAEIGLHDFHAGDMVYLASILQVPITYFFLGDEKGQAKQRLEQIGAYLPRLPDLHQDIIVSTVVDTYERVMGSKSDVSRGPDFIVFGGVDAASRTDEEAIQSWADIFDREEPSPPDPDGE